MVWAATLDAVVDGERPVAELVTLVLAALPVETEVVIIEDVLKMTRGLVDRYSDAGDAARPRWSCVAQACDRLLAASPAGGSRQLAAARGLIGATTDAARLRGWLAGDGVPDGLAVDADLRWLILYRLVVLGAAGADGDRGGVRRDRSATGEQLAARCRAALPDAGGQGDGLGPDRQRHDRLGPDGGGHRAAASGSPSSSTLTGEYVQRYFADMPAMMALRTGMSAERVAVAAYPRLRCRRQTRQLAADLLARPDLPRSCGAVVDDDDDMRRALDRPGLIRISPVAPGSRR